MYKVGHISISNVVSSICLLHLASVAKARCLAVLNFCGQSKHCKLGPGRHKLKDIISPDLLVMFLRENTKNCNIVRMSCVIIIIIIITGSSAVADEPARCAASRQTAKV